MHKELSVPIPFVRARRDVVASIGVDAARIQEMLVQMINKLQYIPLHRPRHGDIVYQTVGK